MDSSAGVGSSTHSLIERARRRDSAAFGELYGQIYADLYRYALYRLGSREEAEDAVQEAALEAFRGIAGLKKPGAFRGWMFTILNARCNRHIRGLVREAIAALPDEDRQLVLLAVVGGFSGNEIADIMKRPPGTLRCRLHRTLKKLRKTLDELDENE